MGHHEALILGYGLCLLGTVHRLTQGTIYLLPLWLYTLERALTTVHSAWSEHVCARLVQHSSLPMRVA